MRHEEDEIHRGADCDSAPADGGGDTRGQGIIETTFYRWKKKSEVWGFVSFGSCDSPRREWSDQAADSGPEPPLNVEGAASRSSTHKRSIEGHVPLGRTRQRELATRS